MPIDVDPPETMLFIRVSNPGHIPVTLPKIAHWANTHKENAEAVEVTAHLVAIERSLDTLCADK